ncbi:MAG: type IX secretion system membrane protein PorP/SprF [Bacteroidetes bacterium]|jgi:type IX secretion system PorP/SprF family membrane protein|nr:type IX secretion system membrane protein PorP/SprF [Bacteroidota bacterium]
MEKGIKRVFRFCIPLSLLIVAWINFGFAQQSQIYTQYMYNKLNFNPAYAGSLGAPTLTALYRNQWIGLEGAPDAQIVSFDAPLNSDKIALGFNFERQAIGIQEHLTFNGVYAYRFKVSDKGKLAMGVNASGRFFQQNFNDPRLFASQGTAIDNAIPSDLRNAWVANVGFGIYYSDPNKYWGIAVPRIAKNDIDLSNSGLMQATEVRHYNFMAGYTKDLSRLHSITVQGLFRWNENAPNDFDVNALWGFRDLFFAGMTYRYYNGTAGTLAESVDVLLGFQALPQLYIGVAYDITLSDLQQYSNGSIEIATRYRFFKPEPKAKYANPRYF